jgi:hypothetical protein
MKTYKKIINGKEYKIYKANGYWRAEDGIEVLASKTKRGCIKAINGDLSECIFIEYI